MKSSLANRGRPFEDLLNLAHSRYQADDQACVHVGRDKPHGVE